MKHSLLSSITLLAALSLSACTGGQKADPETLIIGIESEIGSLDPRKAVDLNSAQVWRMYTQGLVNIDDKMLPEPDLAESFDVKDAKIFTFKLRKDAVFHDGTPVTSADVKWCFEDARSENSLFKSAFEVVQSFEAPDPHTFIIRLKEPRASFLAGDVAAIRVLPKGKPTEAGFGEKPYGSGRFKLVKRDGRDVFFERYDAYKSSSKDAAMLTPFKHVIVRTVADPTTRFLSLKSGDIDVLVNNLPAEMVKQAEGEAKLQILKAPGTNYQYISFNHRLPKFKDVRVRKALAMAIDRDSIIQHKMAGLARPANSILSPASFYYRADIPQVAYNVEEAKKLLKEAGAENLTVELKTSTNPEAVSILQVVKSMWDAIGVKTEIKGFEWATFFADVQKGNFEAHSLRWSQVIEPDIFRAVLFSTEVPPGRNRGFFSNPTFDKLVLAGQREGDANKRKKIYDEVQGVFAESAPYVSLWYPDNVIVATAKLKGAVPHPTGLWYPLFSAKKEP